MTPDDHASRVLTVLWWARYRRTTRYHGWRALHAEDLEQAAEARRAFAASR